VIVRRIKPSSLRSAAGSISNSNNSWKLEFWAEAVCSAPDGTRVLLLDGDTFLTGDPGDIWETDFDVAYTRRPAEVTRYPINAGVFAARANERSRSFMRAWLKRDREFLASRQLHDPWTRIYGGINQASLGSLIESPGEREGVNLVALECLRFNCEDTCWEAFDPERTRIVHVKSALRMHALGLSSAKTPATKNLVRLWRSAEMGV
jgi:hypothetical protein